MYMFRKPGEYICTGVCVCALIVNNFVMNYSKFFYHSSCLTLSNITVYLQLLQYVVTPLVDQFCATDSCFRDFSTLSPCMHLLNSEQYFVLCCFLTVNVMETSDVKRGQNLKAEAKASRPRPELRGWGWGQDYEVDAEAKNNYEKSTK